MKTTVIYHSADFDGEFCHQIAKKFLGTKDVEYIGWDFADKPIAFPIEGTVYVMDLPPDKPFGRELSFVEKERVIWIDHHFASLKQYDA